MNTRTKLLLTVGVVGAIGVLLAIGTSAFFSSSATSGTNVAATGSLTLTDGPGTQVYFDSGAGDGYMKPVTSLANARTGSVVVSGSATITTGATDTLPQDVTLSQTKVGGTLLGTGTGLVGTDPALFKKAQLCITETATTGGAPSNPGDCGVYNGAFDVGSNAPDGTGDITTTDLVMALGNFPASSSATYSFEVWLPNDAVTDNDYQSQIATAEFQFDGS